LQGGAYHGGVGGYGRGVGERKGGIGFNDRVEGFVEQEVEVGGGHRAVLFGLGHLQFGVGQVGLGGVHHVGGDLLVVEQLLVEPEAGLLQRQHLPVQRDGLYGFEVIEVTRADVGLQLAAVGLHGSLLAFGLQGFDLVVVVEARLHDRLHQPQLGFVFLGPQKGVFTLSSVGNRSLPVIWLRVPYTGLSRSPTGNSMMRPPAAREYRALRSRVGRNIPLASSRARRLFSRERVCPFRARLLCRPSATYASSVAGGVCAGAATRLPRSNRRERVVFA
jgi:hypothetical protein